MARAERFQNAIGNRSELTRFSTILLAKILILTTIKQPFITYKKLYPQVSRYGMTSTQESNENHNLPKTQLKKVLK